MKDTGWSPELRFQHALQRCVDLCGQHFRARETLETLFIARYGVHYSEVDADTIIEACDLHGGNITVGECDRIMTELGYPPKAEQ